MFGGSEERKAEMYLLNGEGGFMRRIGYKGEIPCNMCESGYVRKGRGVYVGRKNEEKVAE